MNRILIYEPNALECAIYREKLQSMGMWVWSGSDKAEALELMRRQLFHCVVWNAETEECFSEINALQQDRPGIGIVVTSRAKDPDFVVAALRAGATHYWEKKEGGARLGETVQDVLRRTVHVEGFAADFEFPFAEFIGKHPKIIEIFQLILNIKDTDSTVLITGESGTGKEVVAKAIHMLSPRKKAPMVAINCGAIPPSLLESELFGHVKGAFTGATANRMGRFQAAGQGTLFLDEITDLPFDLQAKLLRAIQNKVFEPVGGVSSINLEARIIAATNQDLETAVAEKRFREDLFYRLNVIPIFMPPLRARKSDIPLLVKSFIDKFSSRHGREVTGVTEEAMRCLMQYQWPGNIRELQNVIERVVLLKREPGIVDVKDLPLDNFKNVRLDRFVANISLPEDGLDFNEAVNEFENELILQALQKTAGNKNKAATLLNLNRTTLVEKLKRKGLRIAG